MSTGAAWGGGSVSIVDEVGSRRTDLIRHARLDFSYGSTRTQLWLWRVHRLRVSQTTIQRVVQELGLPRVKPVRKRRPRQLKLFERERPGDCVHTPGARWLSRRDRGNGNAPCTRRKKSMLLSSSNAGHFLTGDYTPTPDRTLAALH